MVEKLVPNEDIVFLIDGKVMQMRQSIQNLCFFAESIVQNNGKINVKTRSALLCFYRSL